MTVFGFICYKKKQLWYILLIIQLQFGNVLSKRKRIKRPCLIETCWHGDYFNTMQWCDHRRLRGGFYLSVQSTGPRSKVVFQTRPKTCLTASSALNRVAVQSAFKSIVIQEGSQSDTVLVSSSYSAFCWPNKCFEWNTVQIVACWHVPIPVPDGTSSCKDDPVMVYGAKNFLHHDVANWLALVTFQTSTAYSAREGRNHTHSLRNGQLAASANASMETIA